MRFLCLLVLLPAFVLAGCDSTDDSAACEASGFPGTGTLTATVGGQSFTATCVKGEIVNNVLTIGGSASADPTAPLRQIGFSVKNAPSGGGALTVGTYVNLNPADPFSGTFTATSGTVRVESVTERSATGTFSFEASSTTTAQMLSVTDGRFEVTF